MNAANLMNVYCYFESLACIILRCLCHLNFRSSQTPRNLADSTEITSAPESYTICLDKVCAQVKCISSLFFGANVIPLVTVHLSHAIYIYSRCLQFVATSLLYTIRLMLSANPTTVIPSSSNSSYNEAIYRMNRIRNNSDPCNTSIWSSRKAISVLSNRRCTIHTFR